MKKYTKNSIALKKTEFVKWPVASRDLAADEFSLDFSYTVKKIKRFLDLFLPNLPGTGIGLIIPGQGEFGK